MMRPQRSVLDVLKFGMSGYLFVTLLLISAATTAVAFTNADDVLAINKLHAALNSPKLPGWTSSAGDPCGDAWQGVQCNISNIITIILPGANLDGNLGDGLGGFTSIQQLDLSNNRIEGEIPSSLPLSLLALFLSSNALTGSIPDSISGLSQLTAMSLNNNLLVGNIPDAFQTLTSLANLDLSSNSLNGELPASLGNLLSLKSMHLQNNELSGTLDVLQDLPLTDLNIENNKFSGIIPDKMLSIPNFKKDGNLFDSGAPPIASPSSPTPDTSPSLRPPAPPFFKPPSSEQPPGKQAGGPPAPQQSNSEKSSKKSTTTKTVVSISVVAAFMFIIIVIAALLFMPRYCKKRQRIPRNSMVQVQSSNQMGKVQRGVVMPNDDDRRDPRRAAANPKRWNENMQNDQMAERQAQRDHEINRSRSGTIFLPPPPPPLLPPPSPPPAPPPPPVVKVVEPVLPTEVSAAEPSTIGKDVLLSVNSFTIASLQQYTNSFSQDNLIGTGMLGSVYRAELPDGKILAVKKLDKKNSRLKDEEFMQMVISIDKIQHANIVKLVGYCVEHGQWLLIYEYCSNGSVQEAIHSDDGLRLSWNIRVRMALEAAKALKYLHEDCHPPIIHRNFKSTNVLLDDGLAVRVSDCGLAPLITSGSVSQVSQIFK